MKPITRLVLVTALAGAALALSLPGSAPPTPAPTSTTSAGITVEGTGEVQVAPDLLEVRASISATAEVASDAFDEFSELRARAIAGLEASGIDGLSVRGLGPGLSYSEGPDMEEMMGGAVIFGGGQQMESDPRVRYREEFVLTVGGVNALPAGQQAALVAQVLDAAVDQGMQLATDAAGPTNVFWAAAMPTTSEAPAPLVSRKVTDTAAIEQAAFAAAMEHARQRASALAELAGRMLGPVESIEVLNAPGNWTTVDAQGVATARLRVRFAFP